MLTKLPQFLFVVVLFGASVSARPLILVHSETIARNDKLTLGDISEIANVDTLTAATLKDVNLGYSPEVGMVRQITRDKITGALAAAGFPNGSVDLKSPTLVSVRRESQIVDLNQIRQVVEKATLSGLRARGIKAEFIKLDLPSKVEVRTGTIEIRAFAANVRNLFTTFSIGVEVWIDGRSARRFNVSAQVEATASVVVAASDLSEATRLRSPDFTIETVRLDRDVNIYIFDPVQLRGATIRLPISKGQPITTDSVAAGIVVKVGDVVRIVGESGKLSISSTGEARASGHVGDRIQVKNLQSGTMLQGVVVDEGIVSVRF